MGVKSADDLSWHSTSWLPDEPFVRDHKERGSKRPFCSAPEKNLYLGWKVSPSKLMSSQNLCICPYLAIGSLDIFKLRQGHARLGLALNPLGSLPLCEEANLDPELQGDTMWLWRRGLEWCQRLPAAITNWKRQGRTLTFPEPSESAWPCRHLDFWLLVSRTAGGEMSVVLTCPIYGTFFWPPWKTHTASHGSICRSTTPAVTTGGCSPQHWGAFDGSC